jgi:hypothetical protein
MNREESCKACHNGKDAVIIKEIVQNVVDGFGSLWSCRYEAGSQLIWGSSLLLLWRV